MSAAPTNRTPVGMGSSALTSPKTAAAFKAAKEPFLQQRYAFAVVRALFYRQDWPATIAFFDKNTALLSAPSEDVIDCHDCDHEKFGEQAKWTHKNLVDRMIELDAIAKGGGEKGAQAALQLGNALYNITHNGNARSFTESTHQDTSDARLAERYYKNVYDTSRPRELKAQAAWLAPKAELSTLIYREQNAHPNDLVDAGMMIPKTWFPIFKRFSNTKYYKEVLAECGRFRNWVGENESASGTTTSKGVCAAGFLPLRCRLIGHGQPGQRSGAQCT